MSKRDKKTEQLFSAIGEIDDRLLDEAVNYQKEVKKTGLKKIGFIRIMAACLAVAFVIAVGFEAFGRIIGIREASGNLVGDVNNSGSSNYNEDLENDNIKNEGVDDDGVGIQGTLGEDIPNMGAPDTGIMDKPDVGVDSEVENEDEETDISDFIKTEDNRFSTFSADVDTASYAYFRKLVNRGYSFDNLAHQSSIFRIEEFINYFRYSVDQPSYGELFGVYREIVPCPWNSESLLLRLTLQAEAAVNHTNNNLVFLIDVSGSMSSGDKLPLLKQAFEFLVENLGADDTVSIVTYSGSEAVVLDGCSGLETAKIMAAINSLKPYGSTNGEAGLTMAYQIAEKHFKADGNNRIILASDGDLNVGISSKDQLTEYISEKKDQGVYLSVLGFGTGNYRDENMEAIADNGNGIYYYIDGLSEAEKVFGSDLLGTLYTVAEDVKLQLEFNPDLVDSYRLIGYENRVLNKEDFENDSKDAGEVGASHQVTACYEIKLKPGNTDVSGDPYVTLNVRYKNPGEPISLLNQYMIDHSDINDGMGDDTRFICSVIETVMLLRGSSHVGDVTVEDIIADLEKTDLSKNPERQEFLNILKTAFSKKN